MRQSCRRSLVGHDVCVSVTISWRAVHDTIPKGLRGNCSAMLGVAEGAMSMAGKRNNIVRLTIELAPFSIGWNARRERLNTRGSTQYGRQPIRRAQREHKAKQNATHEWEPRLRWRHVSLYQSSVARPQVNGSTASIQRRKKKADQSDFAGINTIKDGWLPASELGVFCQPDCPFVTVVCEKEPVQSSNSCAISSPSRLRLNAS